MPHFPISKNQRILFLLGLLYGLLQLPLSYYVLRFEYNADTFRVLLFNFSLFFTGIGAFFYNYNSSPQRIPTFGYLAFSPIIFHFISLPLTLQSGVINSILSLFFLLSWFFFQGYEVSKQISLEKNIGLAWALHLLGLCLGILITHFTMSSSGPIFIYILVLVLYLFKNSLKAQAASLLFFTIIFISGPIKGSNYSLLGEDYSKSLMKNADLINVQWNASGQTLFFEDNNFISVMLNKRIIFNVPKIKEEKHGFEIARNILYEERITPEKKSIIVGAGGLASLKFLAPEKLSKNLYAVEINDSITNFFAHHPKSPVKEVVEKINYINEDGRFFIERQSDQSIDTIVYESSYYQPLSLSQYLWGYTLYNTDALEKAEKKLKPDGVLVLEQRAKDVEKSNYYVKSATYINWQVSRVLERKGYTTAQFISGAQEGIQSYYLVATKNLTLLNQLKTNFFGNGFLPADRFRFFLRGNHCQKQFSDNFPFVDLSCLGNNGQLKKLAIFAGSIGLALVLILIFIAFRKNQLKVNKLIYFNFFALGFLQYNLFEFFFHYYFHYLYNNNSTFIRIFCYSLVASAASALYFDKISSHRRTLSGFLFISCLSLIVLKLSPDSIPVREMTLLLHTTSVFFGFGFLFPGLLKRTQSGDAGTVLLIDSAGFLTAHLASYFYSFSIGISGYFLSAVIILFYFFLVEMLESFHRGS